jgi:hypothetical protein
MDRVVTLCDKLKQQLAQNAGVDELLLTVQMLQSELLHLKSTGQENEPVSAVAIHIASPFDQPDSEPQGEKIFFELEVNEEELDAEIEAIKKIAEVKNTLSLKNKPPLLFDPVEDIPTLAHQPITPPEPPITPDVPKQEIHELILEETPASLNDSIGTQGTALSDALKDAPIKDLKKGIGLNDRYLFINELFRGDESVYERSIKTINGFSIYAEAEYWIKRELKLKLGWDEKSDAVKQFDQLVKRRFSFT